MSSTSSGSVSSRRKQAKPQRLSHESDLASDSPVTNGHCDQALDCHLCGVCSAKFYNVERFIEHKKNCSASQKQHSVTPPGSDTESAPIDLSKKHALDDLDKKSILEDKSNLLFDPLQTIQTHQQQLLELYAQLAASRSRHTDSEQSSDDGGNTSSYVLSPPSSNGVTEKIHPCVAERCLQRFSSHGALLWHILRRHPGEKLLQCEQCKERFADPEQIRDHRCELPQRSASTGALERSSSPDADRGSVPARTHSSYSLIAKSPAPTTSGFGCGAAIPVAVAAAAAATPPSAPAAPLSRMLFSQFFGAPTADAAVAAPSTSTAAKDTALDLSNPVPNKQEQHQFLPLHAIPQQLIRPPFNFGQFAATAQRPPPHPDLFLNGPTSASLLNNDDDWEALMEVSTTDESEKIRALVGDKALPTTDPNQCLLCRRVLSCKSALQMHYRTHTGERPFKCKICQRAFTTKGNLKTHMGVHRAKHSFRGIAATASSVHHQCPICQKRFFTAQLLQQHIAQHTSQLTRNGILPPFEVPIAAAQGFDRRPEQHHHLPSFASTSNSASSLLQVNATNLMLPMKNDLVPTPFMPPFPFFPIGFPRGLPSPIAVSAASHTSLGSLPLANNHQMASKLEERHHQQQHSIKPEPMHPSPVTTRPESLPTAPLCLETSPSIFSPSGGSVHTVRDDDEVASTSSSHNGSVVPTATPSSSGNTQDSVANCLRCYRIFPNHVALESHMRTHHEGTPRKCSVCGTTFATRSDLKQHTLSVHQMHYSRSPDGNSNDDASVSRIETEQMDTSESQYSAAESGDDDHSPQQQQPQRQQQQSCSVTSDEKPSPLSSTSIAAPTLSSTPNPLDAMQKMWAETEPPPPRQAPVLSKHQCGVCFKHFSSSSALQIHMRTHTGDKPFKCEVCSRAFTTRGNLKVHMGTHMWQQSPSRRGRRIFEFGADGILRAELLPTFGLSPEGTLRGGPFDPAAAAIRPAGFSSDSPSSRLATTVAPPAPPPPPAFPVLPFPLPLLPQASSSGGCTPNQMDAVMWMWKTVCSVCQKICATPQELEQHLKQHLNGTASTDGASATKSTALLQKTE